MNGFELAGRAIRVGLGNDKFTPETTQNLLARFESHSQNASFSGRGGRGIHAGGSGNFDRAGGLDRGAKTMASALDDTDVSGVNFNNVNRTTLMQKLARTDDASKAAAAPKTTQPRKLPISVPQASRCILLRNMFVTSE